MTIGEVIHQLRKKARISQGELADSCKISQTYLSQIETNKREPHTKTLRLISEKLGIPLPVVFFLSLTPEDVSVEKREAFKMLYPSIKAFITEFFPLTSE